MTESANPVSPFEWELVYRDGTRFPRVLFGVARKSTEASLERVVALCVSAPAEAHPLSRLALHIVPGPGNPNALVVKTAMAGPLARPDLAEPTAWVFGFRHALRFYGVVIDPSGHVTAYRGFQGRLPEVAP